MIARFLLWVFGMYKWARCPTCGRKIFQERPVDPVQMYWDGHIEMDDLDRRLDETSMSKLR